MSESKLVGDLSSCGDSIFAMTRHFMKLAKEQGFSDDWVDIVFTLATSELYSEDFKGTLESYMVKPQIDPRRNPDNLGTILCLNMTYALGDIDALPERVFKRNNCNIIKFDIYEDNQNIPMESVWNYHKMVSSFIYKHYYSFSYLWANDFKESVICPLFLTEGDKHLQLFTDNSKGRSKIYEPMVGFIYVDFDKLKPNVGESIDVTRERAKELLVQELAEYNEYLSQVEKQHFLIS